MWYYENIYTFSQKILTYFSERVIDVDKFVINQLKQYRTRQIETDFFRENLCSHKQREEKNIEKIQLVDE